MRDEHRLRRAEVRERRHQRVAGRRRLRARARRRRRRPPAAAAECGGAGRGADRATPARCATGRCAGGGRRRRAARRAAARRSCARPRRRPSTNAGFVAAALEDRRRAPLRSARASSAVSTPASRSARAHARLPVTSSSNSRRSKRNDAPNSNAAASGAVSNRPDQRFVISRQSSVVSVRRWRARSSCASARPSTSADDVAVALEQLQARRRRSTRSWIVST